MSDSVFVDIMEVLVSIRNSVIQITLLFFEVEVEEITEVGAEVGVRVSGFDSGLSVDNAECMLFLTVISVM